MYYEDPWDDDGGLVIDLYPGKQHMDGKTAIQYVRYRDGEGDIGRITRQQKIHKSFYEVKLFLRQFFQNYLKSFKIFLLQFKQICQLIK